MRSKLAIALAITSFLGATAIASAQTEPAQPAAPGASNEGNVGPGTTKMKSGKMKTNKPGTTTGMSSTSGKRATRNPSGNAAPGSDNDSGMQK
jgi:hypothetical protein